MAENTTPPQPPQSASTRASDVSARLQHLRNLLSSERHGNAEQRRAMEALDREMQDMAAEPISSRLDRRRRELEAQIGDQDTLLTSGSPATSPSTLNRSRRRAVRPSERLLRHRERLSLVNDSVDESTTMMERPPPPIEPSEIAIQEYLEEALVNRENRWRAKRRKLDDGTYEEEGKTFSYGYKGQVVPGPLKMEIVSCDGGEYSEPNVGSSLPQHVLQDDATVYCTKSNRCNMLLKHVGGMPISLTKLVIKAPDTGYDSPIQEGMIFVSLDEDGLLEKTEQYEIRYSPKSYRYHHRRQDPHRDRYSRPSREYMNSTRSPMRSFDRSRYLDDPLPPPDHGDTDRLLETALIPGFDITTSLEGSDEEGVITREPWSSYTPGISEPTLNRAHPLRSYIDDRYRPRYDRISFSDNTASSSESEDEPQDPISVDITDEQDTERRSPSPYPPRRRDFLTRNTTSARPMSRHGPPPGNSLDQEASVNIMRQRQIIDMMRAQQEHHMNLDSEWDRWTRETFFRMEMERHHPHRTVPPLDVMMNRRSTPSRIEIRDAATATSTASAPQISADGESGGSGSGSGNPGPASNPPEHVSMPTTIKPSSILHSNTPTTAVPLAPHARFFIQNDKSSVSIRFDPPVAGRYILIKLWAPCPNANIDVQSIVAHGYGGPRFFPSQEVR